MDGRSQKALNISEFQWPRNRPTPESTQNMNKNENKNEEPKEESDGDTGEEDRDFDSDIEENWLSKSFKPAKHLWTDLIFLH